MEESQDKAKGLHHTVTLYPRSEGREDACRRISPFGC